MSKDKVSSQEIIDQVTAKSQISKRAAEEFIKVFISTVEDALLVGEVVKIKNFGTFKLQWNEARKSVNVQTGEDIVIAGYYKVNFTAETILRDQINEPFAHLEAVQLNGEKIEKAFEFEPILDPLRTLNEQATEIRGLLDEIQGLSSTIESAVVENENAKTDNQILVDEIETEIATELKPNLNQDSNINETANLVEPDKTSLPLEIENDVAPTLVLSEPITETKIKEPKRHKIRTWILIPILAICVIFVGLYFSYAPAKQTVDTATLSICKLADKVKFTEIINSISDWISPKPKKAIEPITVIVPKDTSSVDTISKKNEIDSLQILFDNPRIFSEYLGSERIHTGSRLTMISKRYYGKKEFWVYIYEANRELISNPDDIPVGTLIRIPKIDARLIDASNQRCLQKAKELHDIYIK